MFDDQTKEPSMSALKLTKDEYQLLLLITESGFEGDSPYCLDYDLDAWAPLEKRGLVSVPRTSRRLTLQMFDLKAVSLFVEGFTSFKGSLVADLSGEVASFIWQEKNGSPEGFITSFVVDNVALTTGEIPLGIFSEQFFNTNQHMMLGKGKEVEVTLSLRNDACSPPVRGGICQHVTSYHIHSTTWTHYAMELYKITNV